MHIFGNISLVWSLSEYLMKVSADQEVFDTLLIQEVTG